MKHIINAAGALVFLLALGGCATGPYAQHARHRAQAADTVAVMSEEDVIKMAQAKVSDGVIIDMINSSGTSFSLLPGDVVELADSGVSDSVISAMIKTKNLSRHAAHAEAYTVYPPWYVYDPFWDPWYPSAYMGFWPRYYGPYYGFYAGGAHMIGHRGRR